MNCILIVITIYVSTILRSINVCDICPLVIYPENVSFSFFICIILHWQQVKIEVKMTIIVMFGKIFVTNCSTIILQPNWILKLISSTFENMEKLVFSKLPVSQLKFIFDSWSSLCILSFFLGQAVFPLYFVII